MLIHNKVQAHECDICKKNFYTKSDLVKHFRIHLGEKPYGCAECVKWFTDNSTRNKHIHNCHKELNSEQKSKLKCKIQKTIVHDYLKTVSEYISKYS